MNAFARERPEGFERDALDAAIDSPDSPAGKIEKMRGAIRNLGAIPFIRARKRMAHALRSDEGLRIGFVANVAMLLHDRYGITEPETRDRAANEILNLIFEGRA